MHRFARIHHASERGSALIIAMIAVAFVGGAVFYMQATIDNKVVAAQTFDRKADLDAANQAALEFLAAALRNESVQAGAGGFVLSGGLGYKLVQKNPGVLEYTHCFLKGLSDVELNQVHSGGSPNCKSKTVAKLEFEKSFTFIDPDRKDTSGAAKNKETRAILVKATAADTRNPDLKSEIRASLEAPSQSCKYFTKDGDRTSAPVQVGPHGWVALNKLPVGYWSGNNYVIPNLTWYDETTKPINFTMIKPGFPKMHAFWHVGRLEVTDANLASCNSNYNEKTMGYISGCLHDSSEIVLEGGATVRLKDLKPGMSVLNPVTGKGVKVKEVVLAKEQIKAYYEVRADGKALKLSDNHPVLTRHGVKRAEDLTTMDKLVMQDGNSYPVTSVVKDAPLPHDLFLNVRLDTDSTTPEDHLLVANGIAAGDLWLQEKLDGPAETPVLLSKSVP